MTYSADAQAILDAAKAARPEVKRAYLAAGPAAAIVCEQLIVYPEIFDPKRLPAPRDLPGQCAYYPTPGWRLVYARDCYPMPTGEGRHLELPTSSSMSEWTATYVDRVQQLVNAILDLSMAGTLGGGCENVTVGPANYFGPSTGVAWVSMPISIGDDGTPAS